MKNLIMGYRFQGGREVTVLRGFLPHISGHLYSDKSFQAFLRNAYGLESVYESPWMGTVFLAPWWLAGILRPLLRFRDLVGSNWAKHCFEMGWTPAGERCPWPSWLNFGR